MAAIFNFLLVIGFMIEPPQNKFLELTNPKSVFILFFPISVLFPAPQVSLQP